jgi:chromosome segregation ATPase
VEPLALGAVVSLVVGVATAVGAFVGKRGENRINHGAAVMTGYNGLVDNLQEERDKAREERDQLQVQLAEKDVQLSAAYAELARERAEHAGLQAQIAELTTERQRLLDRIAALGGDTQ